MKKFLSLVLALVMTMSLVTVSAGAKDFTDSDAISGADYAEAIDVMSALEIIDGYDGGAFQPQGTLTRGAAAKIIACMMLGRTTAEALGTQAAPFKDVPVGSTFAGYIAYCSEAGLIDGYADGTFRPSAQLTGFAFLKMLLTAMGYDSSVEGFTGPNWTVNVARRAIENGLTDGNDDFVGTQLATREEACLYAVNTIKATLVEYENKGSSITINGVEIVQGASNPTVVTSVNASQATSINGEEYVTGATGQQATYTVEFGEQYMPKLSLRGTTDDFARPTHTWSYDGEKIGTYTDDADLEYTDEVTSNEIYDSLNLTSRVDAEIYVDGVNIDNTGEYTNDTYADDPTNAVYFDVRNNSSTKTGDTGILTQVWKDGHWDRGVWVTDVLITQMHYYVGDVVSTTPASSNRDAYATVVGRGENTANSVNANGRNGRFNTEDFAVDDIVVYNYSQAVAANDAVQNVTVAETATGTLTSFTTGSNATVADNKYNYSCTIANEAANAAVNKEVTVVLDPYGNAIDIDGADDKSYAVVLDYHRGLHAEATLLFADGSVEDVVLNESYNWADEGDIISYEIRSNDRYVLVEEADSTANTGWIDNGTYNFRVGATWNVGTDEWNNNGTTMYANGDTIFLVKTEDANGIALYAAYVGIRNVPSIDLKDTAIFTVYCEDGDNLPATVVYVDATNASVLNPTSDVIFLKGNDDGVSYTTGIGNYYLFDGVVNGELREGENGIMTSAQYVDGNNENTVGYDDAEYALYDGVYYDANNVATLYQSDNVIEGVGVYKQSNEVLGTQRVGTTGFRYYSVADDAFVVIVTEDDEEILTGMTATSVVQDTNDLAFFKLDSSGEIASAYIVKIPGGETDGVTYNVAAVPGVSFSVYGGSFYGSLSGIPAGTTVTARVAADYVVANSGNISWTGPDGSGNYTFTMPAGNVTNVNTDTYYITTSAATHTVIFTGIPSGVTGTINDSASTTVTDGANMATLPSGDYTVTFTGTDYTEETVEFTVNGAGLSFAAPTWYTVQVTGGTVEGLTASLGTLTNAAAGKTITVTVTGTATDDVNVVADGQVLGQILNTTDATANPQTFTFTMPTRAVNVSLVDVNP